MSTKILLEIADAVGPVSWGEDTQELPRKTQKPWGHEVLWARGDRYAAKLLHIKAGRRLSLQYHEVKEETLLVLRGRLVLELQRLGRHIEHHSVRPGQVFHISPGTIHRLAALETCDVMEVSSPELEDIIRLHDDFGRAPIELASATAAEMIEE